MRPPNNVLTIKTSPDLLAAKGNFVSVSTEDFIDNSYIIVDNRFVFTAKCTEKVEPGTIGMSYDQRAWGLWSTDRIVTVSEFDLVSELKNKSKKIGYLGVINADIQFWNKGKSNCDNAKYDPVRMAKAFVETFNSQILQPSQLLLFEYKGTLFELKLCSTVVLGLGQVATDDIQESQNIMNKGVVVNTTIVNFHNNVNNLVVLKPATNHKKNPYGIIRPDFKFKFKSKGLDVESTEIFRITFASRIFPPILIEKMELHHIKGLIVYGAPCFSKISFAKKIGKKLAAKGPKIYDTVALLSKYEKSCAHVVEEVFKYAESNYKNKGDKSSLHIIVFDKMDAVFEQGGNWVAQNFISELFARMNGIKKLNNILIIGMLEHGKLVNNELLKSGRFEVQVGIHSHHEKGKTKKDIELDNLNKDGTLMKPIISHTSPVKRGFGKEVQLN